MSKPVVNNLSNYVMRDDTLYIATDGSCLNNNTKDLSKRRGGSAFYIHNNKMLVGRKLELHHYGGVITNNIAELDALKQALLEITTNYTERGYDKYIHIRLIVDSSYVINAVTNTRRNSKALKAVTTQSTTSTDTFPNQTLILDVYSLYTSVCTTLKFKSVEFIHINSHTNNTGILYEMNNMVDVESVRYAKL